jgi:hypothetical protein
MCMHMFMIHFMIYIFRPLRYSALLSTHSWTVPVSQITRHLHGASQALASPHRAASSRAVLTERNVIQVEILEKSHVRHEFIFAVIMYSLETQDFYHLTLQTL